MSNAAWRLWIAMLSGNVSVFTAPFMNYSKTLHSARYLLFPPPFFPPFPYSSPSFFISLSLPLSSLPLWFPITRDFSRFGGAGGGETIFHLLFSPPPTLFIFSPFPPLSFFHSLIFTCFRCCLVISSTNAIALSSGVNSTNYFNSLISCLLE